MPTARPTLPQRVDGQARAPLPLFDAAASRAIEAGALARHAPGALMERAGLAVARLALALAPPGRGIVVFAGPGHNGGDGVIAARRLHEAGHPVRVHCPGDAEPIQRGDGLVIDALLGLGGSRPPAGAMATMIDALNASRLPVLAVDLPSGLDPDTGSPWGSPVVQATHTLALLTLKPGLFTHRGRDLAGQVWFDDLGEAPGHPATAWLTAAATALARPHDSHKGRYGDVSIVGGAPGLQGAALLAGQAALAAGAGRVYLGLIEGEGRGDASGSARPELMHRPSWWRSDAAVLRACTVACGCGGGESIAQTLPPLLSQVPRLVLDADALNALAGDETLRALLRRRGEGRRAILTPHPLEAARLLGTTTPAVQADRLRAAQTLADTLLSVVVLKGSGTVIAAPGRTPFLNPTGNGSLATAGTGDVLAGWIAGAWAQAPDAAPEALAAQVVHRHGAAADRHRAAGNPGPLLALDLIAAMRG
jgi:hydroxyethylthiazole kinase-like uncharacterized protein yjeF